MATAGIMLSAITTTNPAPAGSEALMTFSVCLASQKSLAPLLSR